MIYHGMITRQKINPL